ncbi:hypothetical protein BCR34DRAFT_118159 [Clohesyomyces aquaticus]|uniref:Uncharacterized protein n=1 Tax=Clohesyomyces aquaticus TaxID=1231657 RepID=A0A1Y1YQE1_9PLEO|nr:hypothetical protein BCR34DRAFT_118159 [Clohesyomyces aquaticus]
MIHSNFFFSSTKTLHASFLYKTDPSCLNRTAQNMPPYPSLRLSPTTEGSITSKTIRETMAPIVDSHPPLTSPKLRNLRSPQEAAKSPPHLSRTCTSPSSACYIFVRAHNSGPLGPHSPARGISTWSKRVGR